MQRHAIFLNGAIGTGKTTLGRALATNIAAGFIDGDDHADPDKPWFASIKQTSERIVHAGFEILATHSAVVIAYPLGRTNWIYFRRKFGDAGVVPLFITLKASLGDITSSGRNRNFSDWERERIKVMIAEGYGSRSFSDAIVDTGRSDFPTTLATLTGEAQTLMSAKG
jgi:hypothetical protein